MKPKFFSVWRDKVCIPGVVISILTQLPDDNTDDNAYLSGEAASTGDMQNTANKDMKAQLRMRLDVKVFKNVFTL